jgi:hypothetical protein
MPDITVTQADIERLLALDAADKAKREKLRAAALRRPRGARARFQSDPVKVGGTLSIDGETFDLVGDSDLSSYPAPARRSIWSALGLVAFGALLGWAGCEVFTAVFLP